MKGKLEAVLFDLDGTLIDTAHDVIGAINELLKQRNLKPYEVNELKFLVSEGAEALLTHAVGESNESLIKEFRDFYINNISNKSVLFKGIFDVFHFLHVKRIKVGVVTNKPSQLAEKLLKQLSIYNYLQCFIYGDGVINKKPHPEPLLRAAEMLNVQPSKCAYVGDHIHDITAAKYAGMYSIAAKYGYVKSEDDVKTWQADAIIESLYDIIALV